MGSTKKTLKQFKTIDAGVMTGTSVLTSAVTVITGLDNIGYQFDWTGMAVGSFAIQVSANHNQDELANVITAGTWVPILLTYYDGTKFVSAFSVPTTVGSPIFIDVTQTSSPYIRCQYTNASSTGVLTATVCGKNI